MIYLIQYDRKSGSLVKIREYAQEQKARAEEARLQLELELRSAKVLDEVVLLEASSKSELEKTHRRYFESLIQLAT